MNNVDQNKKARVKCDVCGKTCGTSGDLKRKHCSEHGWMLRK